LSISALAMAVAVPSPPAATMTPAVLSSAFPMRSSSGRSSSASRSKSRPAARNFSERTSAVMPSVAAVPARELKMM
jgi:hypothetical protein